MAIKIVLIVITALSVLKALIELTEPSIYTVVTAPSILHIKSYYPY